MFNRVSACFCFFFNASCGTNHISNFLVHKMSWPYARDHCAWNPNIYFKSIKKKITLLLVMLSVILFIFQSLLHMTEYFMIVQDWVDIYRFHVCKFVCVFMCLYMCLSVTIISQNLLGWLESNFAYHFEIFSSSWHHHFLMTSYSEK